MLVDACFIIELFVRSFLRDVSDVPAFNNVWMVPALRHDLLLIENQIPYVVLEHLYIIIKPLLNDGSREFPELTDLALHFFYRDFSFNGEPNRGNFRHLLDLLRKFNLPKVSSESMPQNLEEEFIPIRQIKQIWGFKYSATKLLEAGIQFEMDSKQKLMDITFSRGTLKIPPLHIGETTNSLLRNLIAYEQCGLNISQEFTSYVRLLNSLVCSRQDVELLQQKGIITHDLVVEEIVALFESLLQEVVVKDFSYGGLCNEVNAYHIPWWNPRRVKAALNRDYFPNPWRTIQFVFVVVIQLLVVAQTVYAVLAYHT